MLTELLTYSTFEKIHEQKTVFIFEFFFVLLLSLSLLFQLLHYYADMTKTPKSKCCKI